jgi:hypothetical protein
MTTQVLATACFPLKKAEISRQGSQSLLFLIYRHLGGSICQVRQLWWLAPWSEVGIDLAVSLLVARSWVGLGWLRTVTPSFSTLTRMSVN